MGERGGENFLKFGGTFVFGEKFHPNAKKKKKREYPAAIFSILN